MGRIKGSSFRVDPGSVTPSILKRMDIPEIVSLVAPRRVVRCQARDRDSLLRRRFTEVTAKAGSIRQDWLNFRPEEPFSADLLIRWFEK